jgi:hypothetical protein
VVKDWPLADTGLNKEVGKEVLVGPETEISAL